MKQIDLTGKTAVVTGASTGIGRAIAIGLAEAGAKVAINYCNSEEEAKVTLAKAREKQEQCIMVRADVSKKEEINKMIQLTEEQFGRIDILINNAGSIVMRAPVEEIPEEIWDQIMDINLKSVFLSCKAVIPIMKRHGGGVIINMASVASRQGGGPGSSVYATAKAGVVVLTKVMAKELAPFNIRVNAINPGLFLTPIHEKFSSDKIVEQMIQSIPMKRGADPQEMVGSVLYLVSDWASYVTGETLEVNGGMLMD